MLYVSINACNTHHYQLGARPFDTGYQQPGRYQHRQDCSRRVPVGVCTSLYIGVCVCVCLESLFTMQYAINTLNTGRSHRNVNTLKAHALCMSASVPYIYCVECLAPRGNMVGIL